MSQTVEVTIGDHRRKTASAPPPAPPDPNAPPPPPPPTPDELKSRAQNLYDSMGWGTTPEDVLGAPPPPAAPEAPPEPPPAPAPEAPPPAAESQPEPEVEPEPSVSDIIERTGERVGRAVADAIRPPETAPASAPEPEPALEMTPEDERDYRAILFLERTNPAKYAGKAAAFLAYVREHYAYQEEWLKNNAGKAFNQDDEEHTAWYDEHMIEIDPSELDDAVIEMKVDEKIEPYRKEGKIKKAFERELPKIVEVVDKNLVEMIKRVNPELAKLMTDAKGNVVLSDENIKKLEQTEPIAAEVLDEVIKNEVEPLILELEKTTIEEMEYKIDPTRNPIHRIIDRFRAQKENQLLSLPEADRRMKGKDWLSIAQWQAMVAEIKGSRASDAEKKRRLQDISHRYWCLGVDELEDLIIDFGAKKAKAIIEKREGNAKKKYGTAGAPAPKPQNNPPPSPPPNPAPNNGKPRPPSVHSQSDRVVTPSSERPPEKSFGEQAAEVHFK